MPAESLKSKKPKKGGLVHYIDGHLIQEMKSSKIQQPRVQKPRPQAHQPPLQPHQLTSPQSHQTTTQPIQLPLSQPQPPPPPPQLQQQPHQLSPQLQTQPHLQAQPHQQAAPQPRPQPPSQMQQLQPPSTQPQPQPQPPGQSQPMVFYTILNQSTSMHQLRAKMADWSVADVLRFIEHHDDIKQYSSRFAEHEIDGKALLLMIDRNLNLQILSSMFKTGPAMKIEAILSKYKVDT